MFDREEVDTLLDALDALEAREGSSDPMGMIFASMLTGVGNTEEGKVRLKFEMDERARAAKHALRVLQERTAPLRVKLAELRTARVKG